MKTHIKVLRYVQVLINCRNILSCVTFLSVVEALGLLGPEPLPVLRKRLFNMYILMGLRTENRIVRPTVLTSIGRRGSGGLLRKIWALAPTAYRSQYLRPNYPVFSPLSYNLDMGGVTYLKLTALRGLCWYGSSTCIYVCI